VNPVPEARPTSRTQRGRSRLATSEAAWAATASAILVLIAGAMSLATSQPWLFAALGATAVIVASSPGHPTARFHSIVVGHLSALLCAWLVVLLVGAAEAPAAANTVTIARVWASAMAIAAIALVQPSLRAYHPPSAATALLITLGTYRVTWKSSLSMMAGVLVVALVGEWFQRIRLRDEPVRR
jgi:CBS-domain-containing membrane protein